MQHLADKHMQSTRQKIEKHKRHQDIVDLAAGKIRETAVRLEEKAGKEVVHRHTERCEHRIEVAVQLRQYVPAYYQQYAQPLHEIDILYSLFLYFHCSMTC